MIDTFATSKDSNKVRVIIKNVIDKRFSVNLWSKQSSSWLQKFPVCSRRIVIIATTGCHHRRHPKPVQIIDLIVIIKKLIQQKFIHHLIQFIHLDRRQHYLTNNHCHLIVTIIGNLVTKRITSKMKTTGPLSNHRTRRGITIIRQQEQEHHHRHQQVQHFYMAKSDNNHITNGDTQVNLNLRPKSVYLLRIRKQRTNMMTICKNIRTRTQKRLKALPAKNAPITCRCLCRLQEAEMKYFHLGIIPHCKLN